MVHCSFICTSEQRFGPNLGATFGSNSSVILLAVAEVVGVADNFTCLGHSLLLPDCLRLETLATVADTCPFPRIA
jgi:hypothetical protein